MKRAWSVVVDTVLGMVFWGAILYIVVAVLLGRAPTHPITPRQKIGHGH